MGIVGAVCGTAAVAWAAALTVVDLRERRLPDVLTLTGAVAVLTAAAGFGRGLSALLGALALGGLYLAVHLIDPAGLGGGDVKLALALGGLTGALGPQVWALAAFGAPLMTALSGVLSLLRGRGGTVAHGPAMLAASLGAAALALL